MLAQDPVTGQLYQVPDHQPYRMGYAKAPMIIYDGLGNPVAGFWDDVRSGLTSLAKTVVPAVASAIPGIGPAVAAAAPIVSSLLTPSAPTPAAVPPPMPAAAPFLPPFLQAAMGAMAPPMPSPFPFPSFTPRPFCRAPQPVGWVTPALPYTGMSPRRLYLSCEAWPGQAGLVPEFATQPVAPAPIAPGMVPVPIGRRRRRRR